MKRGIYAGSFDPTTRGHLDVIRRASLIVDELHVMIGVNPKKSGGFFPVEKRLKLIEGSLEHMAWFGRDRSAFHVGEFNGGWSTTSNGNYIRFHRGLRRPQDFTYESRCTHNCDIAPVSTRLPGGPAVSRLQHSTLGACRYRCPLLCQYVSLCVASAVLEAN